MGEKILRHRALLHRPYLYRHRTTDRGVRLTLSTYGGRKGTTHTLDGGGVYRYTGIVWVGVVLSVLGHAWCLRWAELHIETAGIGRRPEAPD
ncbi:MAG TPA: hypothetical protein VK054_02700 [Beutenbergiaceae bacterium]|nr:hypothetical protein [Beutenbergiaceae bacterium]